MPTWTQRGGVVFADDSPTNVELAAGAVDVAGQSMSLALALVLLAGAVDVAGQNAALVTNSILALAAATVSVYSPGVTPAATRYSTTVVLAPATVDVAGQNLIFINPVVLVAMAAQTQRIGLRVTIWDSGWGAGSPLTIDPAGAAPVLSAEVSNAVWGMGGGAPQPSRATVRLAGPASTYVDSTKGRQMLRIEGSLDGGTTYETLFTGYTVGPRQGFFPQDTEIQAQGSLSLVRRLGASKSYHGQPWTTDGPIIRDLLSTAGLTDQAVTGSTYQTYQAADHTLQVRASDSPLNWIAQADRIALRPTYDTRFGQIRRDRSLVGSYASEWTYRQGTPNAGELMCYEWSRERPWPTSRTKVRVLGMLSRNPSAARPNAGRRDSGSALDNPNAGDPYTTEVVESDLLETDADCALVASAYMSFLNRVEDVVRMPAPPNPYLEPMRVFTIAAASKVDIGGPADFLCLEVRHRLAAASWETEVVGLSTALGGGGGVYSLLPTADFVSGVTRVPNPLRGGLAYYDAVITCISVSSGPEGQGVSELGHAWSVDVSAAKRYGLGTEQQPGGGTASTFSFVLDGATYYLGDPHVTLTVTDADGLRASKTAHV